MLEVANSCKKEGILERRTYLVFRIHNVGGLKINSFSCFASTSGGKTETCSEDTTAKSLKCGLFVFSPNKFVLHCYTIHYG